MEMKKQRKAEEWKASSEDNVKMQENPGSLLKNCNYQSFHTHFFDLYRDLSEFVPPENDISVFLPTGNWCFFPEGFAREGQRI